MFQQHLKKTQKNKSDIENGVNTTCQESTEQYQPNEHPKCKRKSVILLGDSMIKHTNRWEIAKKLKPEWNIFVRTLQEQLLNVWLIT